MTITMWTILICTSVIVRGHPPITKEHVIQFIVDFSPVAFDGTLIDHLMRNEEKPFLASATINVEGRYIKYGQVKEGIGSVCENICVSVYDQGMAPMRVGCCYVAQLAGRYLSKIAGTAHHQEDVQLSVRPLKIDEWYIQYDDVKTMFPKVCNDPLNSLYGSKRKTALVQESCNSLEQNAVELLDVIREILSTDHSSPLRTVLIRKQLQEVSPISATYDQLNVMIPKICSTAILGMTTELVTNRNRKWIKKVCLAIAKNVFNTLDNIGAIIGHQSRTRRNLGEAIKQYSKQNSSISLQQAVPFIPSICAEVTNEEQIRKYLTDELPIFKVVGYANAEVACKYLLERNVALLDEI